MCFVELESYSYGLEESDEVSHKKMCIMYIYIYILSLLKHHTTTH